MASGDVFESIKPKDVFPQNGQPQDSNKLRSVGYLQGYPLRKSGTDGFYTTFRVPTNGAPLSTGVTVKLRVVEDPNNTAPGLVYQLGVSGAKVVSGTTNLGTGPNPSPANPVAMGAETTATLTAPVTQGIVTELSFAITTANLNTPVAGDDVILYVRRLGTSATDTAQGGELLILSIVVKDT